MTTTTRVFNFSPGPAVLPLPVLEEAQRDLVALPGVGMSVLEISHRGKVFEGILHECEANIRTLAGVPDTTRSSSCRAAPARSSRWCR
jgi:phosphoserine aminotransferase